MASDQLIWQITKNHNSFLHKARGTRRNGSLSLSRAPGSLTNTNTYTTYGIERTNAVDITLGDEGIVMHLNVRKMHAIWELWNSITHLDAGCKTSKQASLWI